MNVGIPHRLYLALIVLAGFAAYAAQLDTYFIKDDLSIQLLTNGTMEFDAHNWFFQLIWPRLRTLDDIFRPAVAAMWAPDYLLFGPDPVGFHLGNVFGHCANGALLYWLVNRLTHFRRPSAGFFAGLLFVCYPLHGEAVVWMTQRFVVFGLLYSLLALIAFDVWLHRRHRRTLILCWVSAALAMFSKELGITLPGLLAYLALFGGPERSFRKRLLDLRSVIVTGVLVLAGYFGLRMVLFGRPLGKGYAGFPTMQAYAEHNRVYERLPESLRSCGVPLNLRLADESWWWAFAILQAAAAGYALLRLISAARKAEARSFVGFALLFTILAFAPTVPIFYVEPSLINSRFGYHASAMLIALLATGLCLPWGRGANPGSRVGQGLVAVVAVTYAVVLQLNLRAYSEGGRQVRTLQEAVVKKAAEEGPKTGFVLFGVPSEYKGCPTVDAYLSALVRPPLVRQKLLAFPFVQGQQFAWAGFVKDGGLPWRERIAGLAQDPERLAFYEVRGHPPALAPLFGAEEPARGGESVQLLEPKDGAIRVVPGPEPVFRWKAPAGRSRFRLHLIFGREPGQQLHHLVEHGRNAEGQGDRISYRLSTGDLSQKTPDLWSLQEALIRSAATPQEALAKVGPYIALQWRVETLGKGDRSVGVSASHRLVIIPRFD